MPTRTRLVSLVSALAWGVLATLGGCHDDDAAPAAGLRFENLLAPVTIGAGGLLDISLVLEGDGTATAAVYADGDGDLATTGDRLLLASGLGPLATAQTVRWDTTGTPPGSYRVVARVTERGGSFEVEAPGAVTVNAAATVALLAPADGSRVPLGRTVGIEYADSDPDDTALTTLLADQDGDLATTADQTVIAADRPDLAGAVQTVGWDTAGMAAGDVHVVCRTVSPTNGTVTAQARITLVPPVGFGVAPGGDSFDTGRRVVAFDDGSCVVVGLFADTVVFGAGEANQTTLTSVARTFDVFLARYDAGGALAWARSLPGTGADDDVLGLARFPDGSFVVAGAVDGTTTFGEGEPNEAAITAVGAYGVFVAKYDADGTLVWVRAAEGFGLNTAARAVAAFADGSCVVAGTYDGAVTFGPGEPNETTLPAPQGLALFVARYGSDGALAWAEAADGGSGDDLVAAATALADGSCVVAGRFAGTIALGSSTLVSAGDSDAFWARYGEDGSVLWARRAGGDGADGAAGLAAIPGSIVLCGEFEGTAVFGAGEPGEAQRASDGALDLFVARCDATDGTIEWVRQAGGAGDLRPGGLDAVDGDSVVLGGAYTGEAIFGSGEAGQTVLPDQGDRAIWVARLDEGGDLAWASSATGAGLYQGASGVAAADDGSCFLAGRFSGTAITFGAGFPEALTLTHAAPTNADDTSIFLVRLNVDGLP